VADNSPCYGYAIDVSYDRLLIKTKLGFFDFSHEGKTTYDAAD